MFRLLILFTLLLSSVLTGKAWAAPANCSYPSVAIDRGLVGPVNQASKLTIISMMKDCAMTAFNAAMETVKSGINCIAHPIKCAEAAIDGIKNAYHFISNLGTELNKMWQSISHLKPDQIAQLLCSVVGSLAPDVLIAILTAGAASGKMGITIARIMLKLKKISDLLKLTVAIPIKLLGELSEAAMARLSRVLKSGQKAEFETYVKGLGCAI